jgi:hypothetical protein
MGVDRRMKELTSNEASVDLPQPLVPQSKTVTDSFLSRILQNPRIPLDTSHKPLSMARNKIQQSSKFSATKLIMIELKTGKQPLSQPNFLKSADQIALAKILIFFASEVNVTFEAQDS